MEPVVRFPARGLTLVLLFLHHCLFFRCWAAVTLCYGSNQYFMFLSSGMHIFIHFYLLTLASRGTLPSVFGVKCKSLFCRNIYLLITFKVIYSFTFPLMYPLNFYLARVVKTFSIATCRDIDMCFRRLKFRHKLLAWQIIVIPHTKKLMLAIECILKLWKVLN